MTVVLSDQTQITKEVQIDELIKGYGKIGKPTALNNLSFAVWRVTRMANA